MGYQAIVSFKKVNDIESLFSFLQTLKNSALQKMNEIAEYACVYDPLCYNRKFVLSDEYEKVIEESKEEYQQSIRWFYQMFSFRFTYLPNIEMVAFIGVPLEFYDCFDGTVYFNDHGDTDFQKSHYNGIEEFEEIWNDWQESNVLAIKTFVENNPIFSGFDFTDLEDVYKAKRILAYQDIFSFVEDFILNKSDSVYVSLFNENDRTIVNVFLKKCFEAAKEDYLEGR